MNKLSSAEIKNKFIDFFKSHGHLQINDSSIIPKNDPTLLFINSGMAPIKSYFTGEEQPPCPRLCNVQPCIRTIDIDSIGDKHHLTSFQMLGSWSFGDYFKEKAIELAYKFLTEYLKIPEERLYVTVFSGDKEMGLSFDEEAYKAWKRVGVPESRIVKCGKEDNFWGPTAETGSCGPCTEVFYDTGDGLEYVPGGDFDTKNRYIEIWNAGVFMQFNKNADGTFSRLRFNSVDTGAGLERLSMVLGGYKSVYETDLLFPIKKCILRELENSHILPEKDLLILTDHLRTISLILSEKVVPSNEGRGYVPRKLIRRCMMIISKHKVRNFDFAKIVKFILESYYELFPNFNRNFDFILKELKNEHDQFKKVLSSGIERLESIFSSSKELSANDAFDLVTTYGFPLDLIKQYLEEKNFILDEIGFENKIKTHKEKSKNLNSENARNEIRELFELLKTCKPTLFRGYETLESEANVIHIINKREIIEKAVQGEDICLVLNESCMYAESGGQCADTGYIFNEHFKMQVGDVQKTSSGVFAHFGTIEFGELNEGMKVRIKVNKLRRKEISANHTAVHLLQSALRNIYGNDIHQAGSKVEDEKLRFDFNYDSTFKEEEIEKIEQYVNEYIRSNFDRKVEVKELSEALKSGAIALFESKYRDKVRVVSYGDISSELCGGTHIEKTGDIGLFIIVSVEGIGKGLKRITAITGKEALDYVQNLRRNINTISKTLKVKPEKIIEKISSDISKKNIGKEDKKFSLSEKDLIYINTSLSVKLGYLISKEVNKKLNNEVLKIADEIDGIVVCIAGDEKKQIIIAVGNKISERLNANELISKLMNLVNGKGGGNKRIATGGTSTNTQIIIENLENI